LMLSTEASSTPPARKARTYEQAFRGEVAWLLTIAVIAFIAAIALDLGFRIAPLLLSFVAAGAFDAAAGRWILLEAQYGEATRLAAWARRSFNERWAEVGIAKAPASLEDAAAIVGRLPDNAAG